MSDIEETVPEELMPEVENYYVKLSWTEEKSGDEYSGRTDYVAGRPDKVVIMDADGDEVSLPFHILQAIIDAAHSNATSVRERNRVWIVERGYY